MRTLVLLLAACQTSPHPQSPAGPPLVLQTSPVVLGGTFTATVQGANPGDVVSLAWSARTGQVCPPPLNGSCVDLANPALLATATADAQGTAVHSMVVPAGAPEGLTLHFQAGVLDPAGPALISNRVSQTSEAPGTFAACATEIVPATEWFSEPEGAPWSGRFEIGQTHIVEDGDIRRAPLASQGREGVVVFHPDVAVPGAEVRVRAVSAQGLQLGVLRAQAADTLEILDQRKTDVPLDAYAPGAFAATVPHGWMQSGVRLDVAMTSAGETHVASLQPELTAPHVFSLTRTPIVLFGSGEEVSYRPATDIAREFAAVLPAASTRWIDTEVWRLDEVVVRTSSGPVRVDSEADRVALTSDSNRWALLKNQFTLRMSLANTGRGLAFTSPGEGDSSPYSYGTYMAFGWVHDGTRLVDMNNAGVAAGWTGWTSLWASECGNGFIHEIGHSLTLAHFTTGNAVNWGIAAEYPQDGVNLATHPWAYDTVQHGLRTWYRVEGSGPVLDGAGQRVGKRDPMNGGESPDLVSCYPQYTGYQAQKAQNWMVDSPTLMNHNGVPGIYRWDDASGDYLPEGPPDANHADVVAVQVPVVTVIGTLGRTAESLFLYPPLNNPRGNVFERVDPQGSLPSRYSDARYLLAVDFADGTTEEHPIARGIVTDDEVYPFSLNIAADRQPVSVALLELSGPLPGGASTEVYRRDVDVAEVGGLVAVEGPNLGNGPATLTSWCTDGVDCASRRVSNPWRGLEDELVLDGLGTLDVCGAAGDVTRVVVPVEESTTGASALVTLHLERVVSQGGQSHRAPATDTTPWLQDADRTQSLAAWIPYAPNAALPAGHYTLDRVALQVALARDGAWVADLDTLDLAIDLEVVEADLVDLGTPWTSPAFTAPDSSQYFLVRDPVVGPTSRVWWTGPDTTLTLPVVDDATGEVTTLAVDARKQESGLWPMNAGQGASATGANLVLSVDPAANPSLLAGHTYRTPGSGPLVVDAHRWHAPDAEAVLGTLVLEVQYTMP